MSRLDGDRYQFIRAVITLYHDHLRTRDHNIAGLHFSDLQNPFDHTLRISIEQSVALRIAQYMHQMFTVFGLTQQGLTEPVHP